uniref:Uncharacterized protein n=1 Tax=Ananas comosus var. bracteatus TaxID=296719 RepID=A0A6V7P990_ANACO|nr:unnamed protein product [Ananas comosus var. bracteatus]
MDAPAHRLPRLRSRRGRANRCPLGRRTRRRPTLFLASSCFPSFPPRSSAPDGCGGLRAPSLARELLSADKRFLFVSGGGGENNGFAKVDLVGEKSAAVEVKVEVGHKGPRSRWKKFGEKKKKRARGEWARSRAHKAEARRDVPKGGGKRSLGRVRGEDGEWSPFIFTIIPFGASFVLVDESFPLSSHPSYPISCRRSPPPQSQVFSPSSSSPVSCCLRLDSQTYASFS